MREQQQSKHPRQPHEQHDAAQVAEGHQELIHIPIIDSLRQIERTAVETTTDKLKLQYILTAAKGSELIQAVCDAADQFAGRIVAEERVRELEAALRGHLKDGKPVLGQTPEGVTDLQDRKAKS